MTKKEFDKKFETFDEVLEILEVNLCDNCNKEMSYCLKDMKFDEEEDDIVDECLEILSDPFFFQGDDHSYSTVLLAALKNFRDELEDQLKTYKEDQKG